MNRNIVVVGGGFAGFWAAVAAVRVTEGSVDVRLVSRRPVLEMRPRLYEANPSALGVDLRPLLDTAGIEMVEAEALGLELGAGTVVLRDHPAAEFSRLVVATGSTMYRPPIPGAENALSIDTQLDAVDFDQRLALTADADHPPTIAVVGAGFSGIELALELRDRIDAHAPGRGDYAHIVLIDRADVVGVELGPGPRHVIEAALTEAGIDVRLGADVAELGTDHVAFATGERIATDLVVLTTGMVAAGFARHVPGERDDIGRVVVNRDLSAPAAPSVFVAGDAAAADTGGGHRALQSCQHALQMGRFAGENAARSLLGEPTLDYVQHRYVTCLDLGRSGAVLTSGWERDVVETGAAAGDRKRFINQTVIYPPVDANRADLLAASMINPM